MASFGSCLSFIITLALLSLPQIFCSCPESISQFNKTIIDNGLGPLNATEYVGGTKTFTGTVPATCHLLRLYIDGCYSSKINVNITNIGNHKKKLSYVTPVLNMSHDGTTYDICTHCGGDHYECFPTATLKVIDKPVLNVNAIATCNGIQVEGQKDNDTVIMATVKDSLNHTVLHCNISSLPYLINHTVLPPDIDFNIEFVGVNPAGVGGALEQTVSFENLIYFEKKSVKVLYEDNKVKAIIRFAFNNSCIMSRAHAVHVKSTCAVGGSRSFSISNSNTITVDMLQSRRKCTFTLSSGKTSHTTTFYDTRPVTATIRPHNTTDGYFSFTGRLLQGVPGMVIQIVRSNNTIHSTQYVPRDSPHNNQIKGSNTKQLEDGNYRVNIYLMKANKTFDPSSLIKTIQMYCIISTATNTTSITTPETEIHTRKGSAIGLIIFAVLVVASFFVILLFCFSPKLQGIVKDFDVKKLCKSSYVFDSQWLMGVIQLPPFLSFNDEGSCQSSKEDCRKSKNTVGAVTGNESPAVAYSKPETDKKAPETDGNQSTMNSTPYVSFQSESDLLPSPDKNEQFLNQDFNSGPSGFVGNPLNAPPHIVVNTLDQKPTFPVPVANFADNLVVLESEVRKRKLSRAFSQEGETKQEDNNATAAFVFPHEVFDTAGDKKTQPH